MTKMPKKLFKYLEESKIDYSLDERLDVITIKTGKIFTFINDLGKEINMEQIYRIRKLQSYKYNNYGVYKTLSCSQAENKEFKTVKDLINWLNQDLEKEK